MLRTYQAVSILAIMLIVAIAATAKPTPPADDSPGSIIILMKNGSRQSFEVGEINRIDFKTPVVIVFKDGHQQTIAASDIVRIDFEAPGVTAATRSHFLGKWEVGQGDNTSHTFFITLETNGDARKTLGASHGTWTVVDGEARISWDDGWHDAIRKVGSKHEKVAFEPGKSFTDKPSNVTAARNTDPRPI